MMEIQWTEFRDAPSAYILAARKGSFGPMVSAMTQMVCSEQEKDEQLKVTILITWQEMAQVLFKDTDRLEAILSALYEVFKQQRSTVGALFLSQVLCTITSLLIQMEELITAHEVHLVEFILMLFEIVEKIKSESNLLLKSTACDCLTELEMSYPVVLSHSGCVSVYQYCGLLVQGLLGSKVGHFFRMSQAENSYMHQHYTMLFTTVLENVVHKYILQQSHSSFLAQDSLVDLLSYSDPLKSFSLPEMCKEDAQTILTKSPQSSSSGAEAFSEVKKGVLSVIDNSYLLTPPCLANVTHKLISIVKSCLSLSPKVLKRLLRLASSHDVQLFHVVLTLQATFGEEICDSGDSEDISMRQLIHVGQPRLSSDQRALVWSWLLQEFNSDPHEKGSPMSDEEESSVMVELRERTLTPTVFDSLTIFLLKCRALFRESLLHPSIQDTLPKSVRKIATNLLKMVEYDMSGPPAVTLYMLLLAYLTADPNQLDSVRTKEVEKLVLELTLAHPQLIPHTIDFVRVVRDSCPNSSLPLNILSEITQYLVTVDLSQILIYLHLHLLFIRHAATNPQISPSVLVQLLLRILRESTLCESGGWDIANIVLDICTTLMQLHPTELIFKDLSSLLQLLAQQYQDLDIRDRAQFYHQLLLTVSGEKLYAILSLASDTSTGSSLAAIVEARISDTVFPSAPPICVLNTSESFLSLHREEEEEVVRHYSSASEGDSPTDSTDPLKQYWQNVGSGEDSVRKYPIKLPYRIRYAFDKRPKEISQKIFALVLKLSTNGPYHPSPDIYVPCLSASTADSSKVITLSFCPKQPVPAEFNVSVTFSADNGLSYTVMLESIKLEFSDLFQPVAIPPSMPASSLFRALWTFMESSELKGGRHSEGMLSTMHLTTSQNDWQINCTHLHDFELPSVTTNEQAGVHEVLIFLPPQSHLLLKFHLHMHEDVSSVIMATDCWEVLPLVHAYLEQLIIAS